MLACWHSAILLVLSLVFYKITHTLFISPIPASGYLRVNFLPNVKRSIQKNYFPICMSFPYSFDTQSPTVPSFFGSTIYHRRPWHFTSPLMVVRNNFFLSIQPTRSILVLFSSPQRQVLPRNGLSHGSYGAFVLTVVPSERSNVLKGPLRLCNHPLIWYRFNKDSLLIIDIFLCPRVYLRLHVLLFLSRHIDWKMIVSNISPISLFT